MTDWRDRPTARRPLLQKKGAKRALVNVGGRVDTEGERALTEGLVAALSARAGERDATLTHPFHAYPARLHPEVARALVALASVPAGGSLLDPFCGSGTVLVEAEVTGLRAVGRDLSPFAVELASLKTARTTREEREAMSRAARSVAKLAGERVRARERAPVPPGEREWFHPHTLAEVSSLALLIEQRTRDFIRHALRMLLSSVLVKVSLQGSDSDARRVPRDVPPGAALRLFAHKAQELELCLAALSRAVPRGAPSVDLAVDDATALSTVPEGSADAVVTSPPYANTYDYAAHHARRYAWLGLDPKGMLAGEVGAARWFGAPEEGARRFRRELDAVCSALARVLRPGGRAFVVMADGAAGEVALRADRALSEAARGASLTVEARASQERAVFDRDSARAFAREPKREHVVVLRRPTG